MKSQWLFALGAVAGAAAMFLPHTVSLLLAATPAASASPGQQTKPLPPLSHTEEKFAFTASASLDIVAPLFGAHRERDWAPGWEPKFIFPTPAGDTPGMVFTVAHQHDAVWVNTQFDLRNGRVQYAYMIPDALVTVITLKLTARGSDTYVEVQYDRTALNSEANVHVEEMARQDHAAGPEWEKQINDYLKKGTTTP